MTLKRFTIKLNFDIDLKFIAILPALNINMHSSSLEFEWLVFAIYVDFSKEKKHTYTLLDENYYF